MSALPIAVIPLWAALLALLYMLLAGRVIQARYRTRTALGGGDDEALQRAIRAHANFAEYVPLVLILAILAEVQGAPAWLVHLIGGGLFVGRAVHAYGISRTDEVLSQRRNGMVLTFLSLLTAAVTNLVLALG